jgi:hypothetical protein
LRRVGALRLAETVVGQRLGADWFSEPRLSAIVQAPPDSLDSEADDERDAYLRERRALLAEDPQLAALVEDPAREKLKAMAAYVAELVGDRAGDRMIHRAAPWPTPAQLRDLIAQQRDVQQQRSRHNEPGTNRGPHDMRAAEQVALQ